MHTHHPHGIRRTILIGGLSKSQLLTDLQQNEIQLNPIGLELFEHPLFRCSAEKAAVETVELSVEDLGHPAGDTIEQIVRSASDRGLGYCPLELGPNWRLQFRDQLEGSLGQPSSQHCAPPGSITVISRPLDSRDETPQGFYLRKIKGVLWLRGYRSSPDHVWSPTDRLLFAADSQPS